MGSFWKLEDVEKAARANSSTFFIPPLSERKNQKAGDSVRLHYLLKDRAEDEPSGERMWVTVVRERGLFRPYQGELQNQPVYIEDVAQGDLIRFKPCHIARTVVKKSDPRWIDSAEQRAFVSRMCFEEGECVRFLYREKGDNEDDSGWRMFSGAESEEYTNDHGNIRLVEVGWMLDRDPTLLAPLKRGVGAVFERVSQTSEWSEVHDWEPQDN